MLVSEATAVEMVKQVVAARKYQEEAKKHYYEMLGMALDAGVSPTRLARELHVTEAAIRMAKKRHNL